VLTGKDTYEKYWCFYGHRKGLLRIQKKSLTMVIIRIWWDWRLKSMCSTLEPHFHFALIILEVGGVSQTICLGWPRTEIFWISASQVARITGMSHHHPVRLLLFNLYLFLLLDFFKWKKYIT
jgi:hypothetical protein